MTERAEPTAAHPTDADLVRLLDGETERSGLRQHLGACEDCRERRRRLAGWSDEVGRILDAADPVVVDRGDRSADPTDPSASRWLMVAAGVLLLISAGLALQPVRAWVVDRAEDVAERLGITDRASSERGTVGRGASVSFVPDGEHLRIQVEARQQSGRLELRMAREGDRVRASVATSDPGEGPSPAFAAYPSELRISNSSGSGASYRVTVPASVRELEIRVGNRRLARLAGEELSPGGVRTWQLRTQESSRPPPP